MFLTPGMALRVFAADHVHTLCTRLRGNAMLFMLGKGGGWHAAVSIAVIRQANRIERAAKWVLL